MNWSVDSSSGFSVLKDVALGGFRRDLGLKFSSDVKTRPNKLTA
jgi:hypothetical protein